MTRARVVSVSELAAIAFHEVASQTLADLGQRKSQNGIARLLGIDPPYYSKALRGVGGSLDRVVEWVQTWERLGYPPLVLVVRPSFWSVTCHRAGTIRIVDAGDPQ